MKDGKKTVTSIFMVPLLKIGRDPLRKAGFVNAFVKDGGRDIQYGNAIYLLFKPQNLKDFKEFLDEEYERTGNIIDDYDYEGGFVVVVYKLDRRFIKDYELIRRGEYSKTSKQFQQEFPKSVKLETSVGVKEEVSLQYRIFNKTQDLIEFWENKLDVKFGPEQEVWQMFDEEKETLTIEKLEQYV
jgi:hypothetical protein